MSSYEVASELGCSPRTVRTWMEKNGVDRRNRKDAAEKADVSESCEWRDKERLHELYVEEGLSVVDVAEELGCGHNTVHRWLKRHGIKTRDRSQDKVPHFNTDDGYEKWRHEIDDTQHSIRVHRLAAVAWFGIDKIKENDIHHKNNIPFDNRQDNLQPMSPSEHGSLHAMAKA